MGKYDTQIETVDSNQKVPVFSLMCPGISLSTLSHDIRLLDILEFKDICNKITLSIEYYTMNTDISDVEILDNKMVQKTKFEKVRNFGGKKPEQVQRTNENEYSREHPYSSMQTYQPSLEPSTDLVGDTDMISSFLETYKITDVTWIPYLGNTDHREDISVSPHSCRAGSKYQCVPANRHVPHYIFTPYPRPTTGLDV